MSDTSSKIEWTELPTFRNNQWLRADQLTVLVGAIRELRLANEALSARARTLEQPPTAPPPARPVEFRPGVLVLGHQGGAAYPWQVFAGDDEVTTEYILAPGWEGRHVATDETRRTLIPLSPGVDQVPFRHRASGGVHTSTVVVEQLDLLALASQPARALDEENGRLVLVAPSDARWGVRRQVYSHLRFGAAWAVELVRPNRPRTGEQFIQLPQEYRAAAPGQSFALAVLLVECPPQQDAVVTVRVMSPPECELVSAARGLIHPSVDHNRFQELLVAWSGRADQLGVTGPRVLGLCRNRRGAQ